LTAEGIVNQNLTRMALLGGSAIACFLAIWWIISRLTELAG
jgi:hypothetical protein